MAVLIGIQKDKEVDITYICIELDSKLLVDILSDTIHPPWAICYIVKLIKRLRSLFIDVRISHIFKEWNDPSNEMATWRADNLSNLYCRETETLR